MNMKHLYTSLDSGVTSGSVTDNSITDDSVIEIYFDNADCFIDTTSQSGHTVYFTVGGNATGTNVCVVVNNLTNFVPYDDTDIREIVAEVEQDIVNLETTVSELDTTVDGLETTIDGLNASNISYDEHSTLYSAMGDIDELETTSKNLVGAINENFTYVSNGKVLIASAITDKGVETSSDATFETMANNINNIPSGGNNNYLGLLELDKPIEQYIPNINKEKCLCFRRLRNNVIQYVIIWSTDAVWNWTIDATGVRPSITNKFYTYVTCGYDTTTKKLTSLTNPVTQTGSYFGIDTSSYVYPKYCKGFTIQSTYIYSE